MVRFMIGSGVARRGAAAPLEHRTDRQAEVLPSLANLRQELVRLRQISRVAMLWPHHFHRAAEETEVRWPSAPRLGALLLDWTRRVVGGRTPGPRRRQPPESGARMNCLVVASVLFSALPAPAAAHPPLLNFADGVKPFIRAATPRIILGHVQVIDGTGRAAAQDQNVIIEAGKIAAIRSEE